jgi:hypothetical protein
MPRAARGRAPSAGSPQASQPLRHAARRPIERGERSRQQRARRPAPTRMSGASRVRDRRRLNLNREPSSPPSRPSTNCGHGGHRLPLSRRQPAAPTVRSQSMPPIPPGQDAAVAGNSRGSFPSRRPARGRLSGGARPCPHPSALCAGRRALPADSSRVCISLTIWRSGRLVGERDGCGAGNLPAPSGISPSCRQPAGCAGLRDALKPLWDLRRCDGEDSIERERPDHRGSRLARLRRATSRAARGTRRPAAKFTHNSRGDPTISSLLHVSPRRATGRPRRHTSGG